MLGTLFLWLAVRLVRAEERWRKSGYYALLGLAGGLGLRLQTVAPDIPCQVFLMLPYVVTLLVLAVFGARGKYPSAAGIPYG